MLLMHPQVSELDFGLREACSGQSAATADQSAGGRLPVGGHATVAECVGVLLSLWGTLDVADQQENMKHHAHMHSPDYFGITASSPGVTNSVYYIFMKRCNKGWQGLCWPFPEGGWLLGADTLALQGLATLG